MLAAHLIQEKKKKENYFESAFDLPFLLLLSGNNHIAFYTAQDVVVVWSPF